MTREEAKKEIEKVFEPAFANYIIKALTDGATESDMPCEDAVSREYILSKAYAYGYGLEPEGYCVDVEDIQQAPSVKVEPQEWMPIKDGLQIEQDNQGNLTAYCPHCHKAIWKTFKQENEDEDC